MAISFRPDDLNTPSSSSTTNSSTVLPSPKISYNSLPPSPFRAVDVDDLEKSDRNTTAMIAVCSVIVIAILTLTLFTVLLK